MKNVIISDEFFSAAGELLFKKAETAEKVLKRYTELMRKGLEDGLVEGETSKAFEKFIENAERFKGDFKKQARYVQTAASSLTYKVDELDGNLYEE